MKNHYKKKIVQFVSASSDYNINLQNALKNDVYFSNNFELIELNLDNESSIFESSLGLKKYAILNLANKIIYNIRFNKYVSNKYKFLKGNIVNIQFVNIRLFFLLTFFKSTFNKIIISFWGSDLLRLNKYKYFLLRQIINAADIITFETSGFVNFFIKKFGNKYLPKIKKTRFGISILNDIDAVNKNNIIEFKNKFKIDINKKVIMLGYNRNKEQQHVLIINSIINANIDKNDVILVFPWIYGTIDEEYKKQIIDLLEDKYEYIFFNKRLTNFEVAVLRNITDIMIQVQTTDVMSSSMLETLYARNQVITGSWLPYDDIYNAGVFMHLIDDVNDVGAKLKNILLKKRNNTIFNKNKEIIYRLYSWKNCINDWIKLYCDN